MPQWVFLGVMDAAEVEVVVAQRGHHLVVGRLAVAVGEDVGTAERHARPHPRPPRAARVYSSRCVPWEPRSPSPVGSWPGTTRAWDRSPCETLETDAASASSILRDASVHAHDASCRGISSTRHRADRFTRRHSWAHINARHAACRARSTIRRERAPFRRLPQAASVGQEHFIRSDVNEHRRSPEKSPCTGEANGFLRLCPETALSQKSGSSSGVPGVTRPFQMRRLSPHAVVG